MKAKLAKIGVLVAGIALAAPAFSSMSAQLPPEQKAGAITYMTGGVGTDQANAMKAAEHHYGLTLEFAQQAKPRNEYLAGINVKVSNASGKMLLDTQSDGPFLMAKLPAGKYTVAATYDGHLMTRTANVSSKHHARLVFVWPHKDETK